MRVLISVLFSLSLCITGTYDHLHNWQGINYIEQDQEFYDFLEQWKGLFKNKEIKAIAEQVQFPLKEAQYAAGRYGYDGLTKDEFLEHFDLVFDPFIPLLLSVDQRDISIVANVPKAYRAPEFANVYQISLLIDNEDGEFGMGLMFWKVEGEYKLRYLTLAG